MAEPAPWDVVVLGDVRPNGRDSLRALGVGRTAAHAGLRTAVAHAEAPDPLTAKRLDLLPALSTEVRLGHLGVTNAHEDDAVGLLVVTRPESLLHLDGAHLQVRTVLVVTDEADARGWSVAAVDERCRELFGTTALWGGPASVHGGGSRVRSAVPQERWCSADLATVVGAGWLTVPTATPARHEHRVDSTLVVGHHLEDAPVRWPTPATAIRTAFPQQIDRRGEGGRAPAPVEVHCLHGLRAATKALGRRLAPPTWLSFAGTGMTTREFLSHIDVWMYFGTWDEAAETAALEALGAGLPCVLGEDAAASDLAGTVRCVPAERSREALEDVLGVSAMPSPTSVATSTATREATWTQALHDLVTNAGPRPGTHANNDLTALASDPN